MVDTKKCIVWKIPIHTVSEANCTEHYLKKNERHQQQKYFVRLALEKDICQVSLPCHVKVIRLSPRKLDYDNLVSSQKWVVDAICDSLIPGLKPGRADADSRITISYDQENNPITALRIEISY